MNIFKDVNRIIFDLDNVIIKHNFESDAYCTCMQLGLEYSDEFKKEFAFMFQNLNGFVKNKKVTIDIVANVIEECMPILKKNGKNGFDFILALSHKGNDVAMENAKEILEYLEAKGYEIVALTNWFYSAQVTILKQLKIFDYFNRIYAWDDCYGKPNRLAFIKALEGKDPIKSVMIGDDLIGDIIPARRLGIHTIGFGIDYDKAKKISNAKRAEVDVKNLLEIKEYL